MKNELNVIKVGYDQLREKLKKESGDINHLKNLLGKGKHIFVKSNGAYYIQDNVKDSNIIHIRLEYQMVKQLIKAGYPYFDEEQIVSESGFSVDNNFVAKDKTYDRETISMMYKRARTLEELNAS